MTPREQGFLLLTSQLGAPERKPMTVAQFRTLTHRARTMEKPVQDRDMRPGDLVAIGYSEDQAQRILQLLSERELLEYYLGKARRAGCAALTRVSTEYPARVRKALGQDSPGCLWAKGDIALLDTPCVALVGSRELRPENREFARELGRQAARQGYTLVSGNARGADKEAQQACLDAGGCVISVVADRLDAHRATDRKLYLSEDSFDMGFSAQRALSRNRIIHSLGTKTFVAQATLERGGTWDGTMRNLRLGLSSVFCFRDGSRAAAALEQMGAVPVTVQALEDISALKSEQIDIFGR